MKLVKVRLWSFFRPGEVQLLGKGSAVTLANHGPVVAGKDVEAARNIIEELEDTCTTGNADARM